MVCRHATIPHLCRVLVLSLSNRVTNCSTRHWLGWLAGSVWGCEGCISFSRLPLPLNEFLYFRVFFLLCRREGWIVRRRNPCIEHARALWAFDFCVGNFRYALPYRIIGNLFTRVQGRRRRRRRPTHSRNESVHSLHTDRRTTIRRATYTHRDEKTSNQKIRSLCRVTLKWFVHVSVCLCAHVNLLDAQNAAVISDWIFVKSGASSWCAQKRQQADNVEIHYIFLQPY